MEKNIVVPISCSNIPCSKCAHENIRCFQERWNNFPATTSHLSGRSLAWSSSSTDPSIIHSTSENVIFLDTNIFNLYFSLIFTIISSQEVSKLFWDFCQEFVSSSYFVFHEYLQAPQYSNSNCSPLLVFHHCLCGCCPNNICLMWHNR